MRNGGTCVLKDDMAEILGMFRKADVLVLATPVYFYGISAQMKTLLTALILSGSILVKKKFTILYRLVWARTSLKDRLVIWMVL